MNPQCNCEEALRRRFWDWPRAEDVNNVLYIHGNDGEGDATSLNYATMREKKVRRGREVRLEYQDEERRAFRGGETVSILFQRVPWRRRRPRPETSERKGQNQEMASRYIKNGTVSTGLGVGKEFTKQD